ncbi:hypothetical protein C8Q77DRAFT_249646 [Trametes polyzona]|nr:hypothetical protein C8Q77DRAFT_249646 [Trametes polyzona]
MHQQCFRRHLPGPPTEGVPYTPPPPCAGAASPSNRGKNRSARKSPSSTSTGSGQSPSPLTPHTSDGGSSMSSSPPTVPESSYTGSGAQEDSLLPPTCIREISGQACVARGSLAATCSGRITPWPPTSTSLVLHDSIRDSGRTNGESLRMCEMGCRTLRPRRAFDRRHRWRLQHIVTVMEPLYSVPPQRPLRHPRGLVWTIALTEWLTEV